MKITSMKIAGSVAHIIKSKSGNRDPSNSKVRALTGLGVVHYTRGI